MDKDYSRGRQFLSRIGSGVARVLIVAALGTCSVGIYVSYIRLGSGEGKKAIILLPLAFYRGIRFFIEPPAWERNWRTNTEKLAFLLAGSCRGPMDTKLQADLAPLRAELKDWIADMPAERRTELTETTWHLRDAFFEGARQMADNLTSGQTPLENPYLHPSVQRHVRRFEQEEGFLFVWQGLARSFQESGVMPGVNAAQIDLGALPDGGRGPLKAVSARALEEHKKQTEHFTNIVLSQLFEEP